MIRLGIELDERVAAAEESASAHPPIMGVADDRFLVGWIGRMTGVKRRRDVLRAFKKLRDQGVDATLCMVGDGPERDELEELAGELGLMRDCLFLGLPGGRGARSSQRSTPSCSPPRTRARRSRRSRALASGCPVVATRVGGVPDVVEDGVDGILVEPRRPRRARRPPSPGSQPTRSCAGRWARPAGSACSRATRSSA